MIEQINPILRGWVKYFAIGHSSRCFSYIQNWVETKIRPSDPSVQTPRLRLEAMEPGMAVRHVGTLLGVPRILSVVELGGRSSLIGPITLDVKCAGARSAGNPHATCDVAGAGNRLTVGLVRHSQRKRGEMDRPNLRSNGASPRPYRDAQRSKMMRSSGSAMYDFQIMPPGTNFATQ